MLSIRRVFSFCTILYSLALHACYALSSNLPINKTLNHSMTENTTSSLPLSNVELSDFEKQIATKMALDIRYFCSGKLIDKTDNCLQPVIELPTELARMITNTGIGSVVLFAENLESTSQIIKLTDDLQAAAIKSDSGNPLIISVDQEGGRVVRYAQATSFAGNMAIGATYSEKGTQYASKVSTVIANELIHLGINNNYAPVVDVNTNPRNPVINTRSYGEDPKLVSELGAAAVSAFQSQGVMATLKHFPGHGDTHVDSHLGLPLVEHDLSTIEAEDLAPFQWAIKHSDPAMIMTAHIQYPVLDNSTIENNKGERIIRPATMSRKILTELLRKKMKYDGIIATDALDMAGISHYFNEVTAVVETFVAGADLAVMPFKIRKSKDIEKFTFFIKAIAQELQRKSDENEFSLEEISESITRINRYKRKYITLPETSITERIHLAEQQIAKPQHLLLEQSLADNAVVLLTNKRDQLPADVVGISRIHLFVLNWKEFGVLKQAITLHWQNLGKNPPQISATVVAEEDAQLQIHQGKKLAKADLIIATVDTKIASAVDIGGAEDLLNKAYAANDEGNVSYKQLLTYQLQKAKDKKVMSIIVAKGSPYLLAAYTDLADSILVTFEDRIYQKDNAIAHSPGYQASIAIIFGKNKALGKLPVSLTL